MLHSFQVYWKKLKIPSNLCPNLRFYQPSFTVMKQANYTLLISENEQSGGAYVSLNIIG
jgi:hypothetical protein